MTTNLRLPADVFPVGHPSAALNQVISAETDKARTANAAWWHEVQAGFAGGSNFLSEPIDHSKVLHWYEYLTQESVLVACSAELGVDQRELLRRILMELHPRNWEVFFWMKTSLDLMAKAKQDTAELWGRYEKQQADHEEQKRVVSASGGRAKNALIYGPAVSFVIREWEEHAVAYAGNKTAFARDYVPRIKNELGIDVAHKTLSTSWLKGR